MYEGENPDQQINWNNGVNNMLIFQAFKEIQHF